LTASQRTHDLRTELRWFEAEARSATPPIASREWRGCWRSARRGRDGRWDHSAPRVVLRTTPRSLLIRASRHIHHDRFPG